MTIFWPNDYPALDAAIRAVPNYQTLTDQQITDTLNAQTEVEDGPVDVRGVRRKAIEERVWGKLQAFGGRAFVTTAATQDLTNACRNFLALFSELEGSAPLVRNNALWNAMDADLTVMTASTGGGPVLTAGQATYMRSLGDRTRARWTPIITSDVVAIRRV
jgi:hypothetical protein